MLKLYKSGTPMMLSSVDLSAENETGLHSVRKARLRMAWQAGPLEWQLDLHNVLAV